MESLNQPTPFFLFSWSLITLGSPTLPTLTSMPTTGLTFLVLLLKQQKQSWSNFKHALPILREICVVYMNMTPPVSELQDVLRFSTNTIFILCSSLEVDDIIYEPNNRFWFVRQNSTITPSLQDHWTQLFLMDGSPQEKHMNEEEK